jgi:hypothetical protein
MYFSFIAPEGSDTGVHFFAGQKAAMHRGSPIDKAAAVLIAAVKSTRTTVNQTMLLFAALCRALGIPTRIVSVLDAIPPKIAGTGKQPKQDIFDLTDQSTVIEVDPKAKAKSVRPKGKKSKYGKKAGPGKGGGKEKRRKKKKDVLTMWVEVHCVVDQRIEGSTVATNATATASVAGGRTQRTWRWIAFNPSKKTGGWGIFE